MFRAAGFTLVFFAMFSIAGGHWAVLQAVAWTGMVIEYSQSSTFSAAMKKTFSGEAPCTMCRSIEKGRQQESRIPAVLKSDKKIDGLIVAGDSPVAAPCPLPFPHPPVADEAARALPFPPPVPVPITA